jgi:hypothetical protein
MGIIHTPRTLYAVAKGFLSRSRNAKRPATAATTTTTTTTTPMSVPAGIGRDNPHLYTARMGLFDVDYLGHMNNASYLSHAEYARWQMCAENGLISAMWQHNMHFVVLGSSIRYRKELRPLFRSFCIETTIAAIDDTNNNDSGDSNIWIVHNFRLRSSDSGMNNDGGDGGTEKKKKDDNNKRIMAQVLIQGAAIQGRKRMDPAELLNRHVGIDPAVVDALRLSPSTSSGTAAESASDDDALMIRKYVSLQQSFQELASTDDKKHM